MRLQSQPNGCFMAYHNTENKTNPNAMITTYLQTPVLEYSAGDIVTLETGYNSEKGFYIIASANGESV